MNRFVVACLILAPLMVSAQYFPRSSVYHADRASYEQWTNLIHAVNQRCEVTLYGYSNAVPPLTNITGVYLVSPEQYRAIWPVSAGLGIGTVNCTTNVQTDEVFCWTNYAAGFVPVAFTNMVGTLTPEAFSEWKNNDSDWEYEDIDEPIVVTNVAMTAENIHALDTTIRRLVPYFLDTVNIEEYGGLPAYFSTTNETGYVQSPPFLTISSAWSRAGLPVRIQEDLTDGSTNRSWHYLFSLAPEIESFEAQLASMTLVETNRSITTNLLVSGGVTSEQLEVTTYLGWMMDPYVFDERVSSKELIYSLPTATSAVVYAILELPHTGDWEHAAVDIVVSGQVFSASHAQAYTNDTVSIQSDSVGISLSPYLRVATLGSSNSLQETIRMPPDAGYTPLPSVEGSRVSIHMSNAYYRLKDAKAPRLPWAKYVEEITVTAALQLWQERLAIVTQLTHSACYMDARYFDAAHGSPVPVLISPVVLSNGFADVEFGPPNYDVYGCADASQFNFYGGQVKSSDRTYTVEHFFGEGTETQTNSIRIDDFADRPFWGFIADLCLNESGEYYDTWVSRSRMGGQPVWKWSVDPRVPLNYTVNGWYWKREYWSPFRPPNYVEESWSEQNIVGFGNFVSAWWPRSLDIQVTNLTFNVVAAATLYAQLYNAPASATSIVVTTFGYSGDDCFYGPSDRVYELLPHPLESLPSGYYYPYADSVVSGGTVEFSSVDFSLGVFPDSSWLASDTVSEPACRLDLGSGGPVTNAQGRLLYEEQGESIRQVINYINYSPYRNASRRLEGVWVVFDWQFDTLIINSP
jgi:hypothetical protein